VERYIGGMLIQSAGDGQDLGLPPAREADASRDAGEAGR
jgi:hypothetical protein